MKLDWKSTLSALVPHFQALATTPGRLGHLMVEVNGDGDHNGMMGPPWFQQKSGGLNLLSATRTDWSCLSLARLPDVAPGFREPLEGESFDDGSRVVRDKGGTVRAVFVAQRKRHGIFFGRDSGRIGEFESLANAAANCLAGASDLSSHYFAAELCDLFRRPRGGVRYVFGDIDEAPKQFLASGWDCGILPYDNGVLIDVPISESAAATPHWLLLLHRLGWKRPVGSPLAAACARWQGNMEVAVQNPDASIRELPLWPGPKIAGPCYSILGTKDAPIDVALASVFAIQLLMAGMSSHETVVSQSPPRVDYSRESWNRSQPPEVRALPKGDLNEQERPTVGIIVATEVERQAVLNRLKPPGRRRSLLKVCEGSNTFFIGRMGAVPVVLVMSAMGSIGRDAAIVVTSEAIDAWELRGVVMVGIAFGRDSDKQMIGGVLVSEEVISYEPQRLGAETKQDRGEVHRSGVLLLNRFRNVLGWSFKNPAGESCAYQFGAILSGEKLVDNINDKAALFARYPRAIGGEMEGTGVAAAAERKRCEWIVVKAICDWGDGTKQKDHQGFAAAAAVDLVAHVFSQLGAIESLCPTNRT